MQPNAPGNVGSFGITFADLLGGLSMLFARFVPMLAALAVAGSLAGKRVAPAGPGTFRTDTPTFVLLLIFVVILVAALTFFPAVLLGPVVQGLTDPRSSDDVRRDLITSIVAAVAFTVLFGLAYPLVIDRRRAGPVPGQGRRQPDRARRQGRRLAA